MQSSQLDPLDVFRAFKCDMYKCFTVYVDNDESASKEALEVLQKAGFNIIDISRHEEINKTYIVASSSYNKKRQMDLADRLYDLLIEEGQYNADKYGLHLGDQIKFTPEQVAEIVRNKLVR